MILSMDHGSDLHTHTPTRSTNSGSLTFKHGSETKSGCYGILVPYWWWAEYPGEVPKAQGEHAVTAHTG